MENADPANTGHLPRSTPADLSGAREIDLDGDAIAQVVEGPASLALVGDLSGTLHAITAAGGTAWTVDTGGPLRSAPLWTGEHVVAVPRADEAIALDAAGGTAWTLEIDNARPDATVVRMASPALHPSGDVLVPTLGGSLHRVAPNGSTTWTYDVGGDNSIQATPAIAPDGDVLVAGFVPGEEDAGTLARLEADTGEPVWEEEIGAQVVGAPVVVGDGVLVPLRDQNAVQARALEDASERWTVDFDDRVTMSPTVHEGIAVAGDVRGVVRGIGVASGQVEWTFNPLQDDPNASALPGAECTVLTVADSPAIDRAGIAWTPYWNANICEGFPPRSSGPSPFYLLDVHDDGEVVDRQRYDKANHGPGLLATGVWAGTDEALVRTWPTPGALEAHAFHDEGTATLLTNTDRRGAWTIDWGEGTETGEGLPPLFTSRALDPGPHQIRVTVDGATTTTTVTVPDEPDPGPEEPDAPQDPSDPDGQVPDGASEGPSDGEDAVPAPALGAVLAALLAAAGRRTRA